MSIEQILRTQWMDYQQVHGSRVNFIVHLVTVPIFLAGTVACFWGVWALSLAFFLGGLLAMMGAIAAQGWGHKKEACPPAPFTSRANAFFRIVLEQWVTFPRYVLYVVWRALRRRKSYE